MKIVIATPLYPPDTASVATYVKELATRLSEQHSVTVVAYTRLPEQIPGVRIVAIEKRRTTVLRVWSFFLALLREARHNDVVFIENGRSVELPAGLVAHITRTPLLMHIGDKAADQFSEQHRPFRIIRDFTKKQAAAVLAHLPLPRPEILPFAPKPGAAFSEYEASWKMHLMELERVFSHVKK